MKRLDIFIKSGCNVRYKFTSSEIDACGCVILDRFMDCLDDAVNAVYERLEENNIKLVGKCEVYCNGKLWEVVDNG